MLNKHVFKIYSEVNCSQDKFVIYTVENYLYQSSRD